MIAGFNQNVLEHFHDFPASTLPLNSAEASWGYMSVRCQFLHHHAHLLHRKASGEQDFQLLAHPLAHQDERRSSQLNQERQGSLKGSYSTQISETSPQNQRTRRTSKCIKMRGYNKLMYKMYTFPLIKNKKSKPTPLEKAQLTYPITCIQQKYPACRWYPLKPAAYLAPEQVLNVKALATPSRNKGIKASAECTSKLVGRPAPNDPTFAKTKTKEVPINNSTTNTVNMVFEDPAKRWVKDDTGYQKSKASEVIWRLRWAGQSNSKCSWKSWGSWEALSTKPWQKYGTGEMEECHTWPHTSYFNSTRGFPKHQNSIRSSHLKFSNSIPSMERHASGGEHTTLL